MGIKEYVEKHASFLGRRAAEKRVRKASALNPQEAVKEEPSLTHQQITQYLQIIKEKYPPPIARAVEETLSTPPRDTQTLQILKQEIQSQKPPYKTTALQKHKTPKQTIKQAQKT